MAASGLSTTDAVRREIFGGLMVEFVNGVREEYRRTLDEDSPEWKLIHDGWYYEPSVAERVFDRLLQQETRLQFWRKHHLVAATVRGDQVTQAELESPAGEHVRVIAKTFIDGTYEGDLAAAAKVPYRVGREGREEHGESLAGIHYMNWKTGVADSDAGYRRAVASHSGLLCAQHFHRRPGEARALGKPDSYDQHLPDLLPLLDDFAAGRVKSIGLGHAAAGP